MILAAAREVYLTVAAIALMAAVAWGIATMPIWGSVLCIVELVKRRRARAGAARPEADRG